MTTSSRYKVVLSGHIVEGFTRQEVINSLAELFHSSAQTMAHLLMDKTFTLKKTYDQCEAEKICQAIRRTGAECVVQKICEVLELNEDEPDQSVTSKNVSQSTATIESTDNQPDSAETGMQRLNLDQAIATFIGPNEAKYCKIFTVFADVNNPSFSLTWHWPAFFLFPIWAMYRRLWKWAIVGFILHFIAGYVFIVTELSFPLNLILSLVTIFLWPCTAHYIYFKHVIARVQEPTFAQATRVKGSVSDAGTIIGSLIMLMISIYFGYLALNTVLAKHGTNLEAVLPGGVTQYSADGVEFEFDKIEGSEVKETLNIMSFYVIGTLLKSFSSHHNTEQSLPQNNVVDQTVIAPKLHDTLFYDAWDTPLYTAMKQGKEVLISAGADRVLESDDDLYQEFPRMRNNQ